MNPWHTQPIGAVCTPTEQRDPRDGSAGEFRYVDITGIDRVRKRIAESRTIPCADAPGRARKVIRKDDVLVSTVRPNLNAVAMVPEELDGEIASTGFCVLRANRELLDPRYLFYRVISTDFVKELTSKVRGANYPAVSDAEVNRVDIPVPTLSEQHRIVEILDQADHLRRLRAEVDAKADGILPAIFLRMFGDPATNPMKWQKCALHELATITTGNTPSRRRPEYYGEFIEWVKSDNLNTASHYVTTAAEGLSNLGAKVARTVPAGSTLVTCIAGSPGAIGNSALADREVAFNQQINAATPKLGVDSWFLYGQFLAGKRLVQDASTGGMKGLVSKHRFSRIEFMVPPLDLQRDFGRHCNRLCNQKQVRLREVRRFNRLFDILVVRAFSGKLTESWRERSFSGVGAKKASSTR